MFPFFHCIYHFFHIWKLQISISLFLPFLPPSAIFLVWMGKLIYSLNSLSVSLQGWRLVWLNLLFWLFSFSIHFLLCWAIRFPMLFFDPKMLSFTWCVQVSGNLNNTLTDIYDRYLTVNYLLSGPSILSDTKILWNYHIYQNMVLYLYSFILAPRANLVDLKCFSVFLTYNYIHFHNYFISKYLSGLYP